MPRAALSAAAQDSTSPGSENCKPFNFLILGFWALRGMGWLDAVRDVRDVDDIGELGEATPLVRRQLGQAVTMDSSPQCRQGAQKRSFDSAEIGERNLRNEALRQIPLTASHMVGVSCEQRREDLAVEEGQVGEPVLPSHFRFREPAVSLDDNEATVCIPGE